MAAEERYPELSLRQFLDLEDDSPDRLSLVRGRLVREPCPAPRHGSVMVNVAHALKVHVESHQLGVLVAHASFALFLNPPTVRGPDVAFVSHERMPKNAFDLSYWRLSPDLAVEILSPSNHPRLMAEKVADYLEAGSSLVWVIDPDRRNVIVHAPGKDPVEHDSDAVIDGGAVLPDLRLPVGKFFEY